MTLANPRPRGPVLTFLSGVVAMLGWEFSLVLAYSLLFLLGEVRLSLCGVVARPCDDVGLPWAPVDSSKALGMASRVWAAMWRNFRVF